ncbi:MAG: TetR/AcrR family transcriptional regulator [Solirubrobacterales bacterium]
MKRSGTVGQKGKRAPLSRESVLEKAVELADRTGIESLSMRKLGAALGVEAMSLYNHVGGKDDLIDGMVDLAFSEIALPVENEEWRLSMRSLAFSTREVLRCHPWAAPLMDSRLNPGPATLGHHDAVIGKLRAAGFSIAMAAHTISLLDAYTYGFVQQELSLPFDTPEQTGDVTKMILDQMPADEYPNLAEMATGHVLQPGYDFSQEFEFGLDLILDGIEGNLEQE